MSSFLFLIMRRARIGLYSARSINKTLIFFREMNETNKLYSTILSFSRAPIVDRQTTKRPTIKIIITNTAGMKSNLHDASKSSYRKTFNMMCAWNLVLIFLSFHYVMPSIQRKELHLLFV